MDSLTLLKKEAVSIVRYSSIILFNNVVVMTTEELHTSKTTGFLVFKCTQTKKNYSYQSMSLKNSSSATFYDIKRVFICKLFLMKCSISSVAANLFKGKNQHFV